jgi:hypothetical protein
LIYIIYAKSDSFLTLWQIEDKGKFAEVKMTSGRKDKRDDSYKNSSWSFVRFVNDAFEKVKNCSERDRIRNLTFSLEWEPYTDKNGQTVYAKSPRMVVFDFDMAEAAPRGTGGTGSKGVRKPSNAPYTDMVDEESEELPF